MGKQDRLSLAQVSVTRDRNVQVRPGLSEKDSNQPFELHLNPDDCSLQEKSGVQRDLVVATTSRVQLERCVADLLEELGLDETVNIFVLSGAQPAWIFLHALLDFRRDLFRFA